MELRKLLYALICFLLAFPVQAQELDGKYYKLDCEIKMKGVVGDTIKAVREPGCEMGKVDNPKDGFWIVYNAHDPNEIVEQFKIVGGKIEGLRTISGADNKSYNISYRGGKFHGPYSQYSKSGKIILFVDYHEGEPSGDYYYYSYDSETDELTKIIKFNRKGKKKKVQDFPGTPPNKFYEK